MIRLFLSPTVLNSPDQLNMQRPSCLKWEVFWKNLDWPEPPNVILLCCNGGGMGIAECSVYYVSESARRLDCIEELFDEKGNFQCQSKGFLCTRSYLGT